MIDPYEQVAITGCGWVTPLVAGTIDAVLEAHQALGEKMSSVPLVAVKDDRLADATAATDEVHKEPAVRLAAAALEIGMRQAALREAGYPPDRIGLAVGCALAGLSGMIDFAEDVRHQSSRFVSPLRFPQTVGNYLSGALIRAYDLRGPSATIACGPASSLEAVREGIAILRRGEADVVVAGGSERLWPELVKAMHEPARGFADGACFFVLERLGQAIARKTRPMAVVDASLPKADKSGRLLSTAGFERGGAVCVERWIGRTLGADAAAALAAAIGAAAGLPVPVSGNQPCARNTRFMVEARNGDRVHRLTGEITS